MVSIKMLQAKGGRFVIAETSKVIPIQNMRSSDLKMQMLELEGGLNWTPPILRSFGGDCLTKGSHNRLPKQMSHGGEFGSSKSVCLGFL
jgi:hypothetical protein